MRTFIHKLLTPFRKFSTLSLKKKIIVIILLIIIVIVGMQFASNASKEPPYTLAKAHVGKITETVSETGTIAANGRTDVYSPTNGIVENIYVTNGSVVTEGQELFTIQSSATEQEQNAAHANYLAAQTTLNAAKSNANLLRSEMYGAWETFRSLATNSTYENSDDSPNESNRSATEFQVAQDIWKATEAQYKDQETAIAQAQAAVSSTWLLYQATQNAVVKAPVAGTISNISVTTGNSVKAHLPTSTEPPIATIANVVKTEVVVALGENDIAKISPDQEVSIEVNSVNDKEYKGIIRRVDTIGTHTGSIVKYNAYIEILDPDDKLRPGMTADTTITTLELSNVLTVPNSAVKPYEGGRAVRVVDPQTKEIEYLPVQIGIRGEGKTQILKGINEGQEVITSLSNEQIKRPGLF